MCALLFCARISVTHRSKEKYLIAELKGSRVKYSVSGAWNINYAERKKKNKQTDMTTKILPDSTERGNHCGLCAKRGRQFKRKFTIANFGHPLNVKEDGRTSLFGSFAANTSGNANLSYRTKRTKEIIQ